LPAAFSEAEKQRLTEAYVKMISNDLVPTYSKLANFLKKEYVPAARKSTGIAAITNGDQY
jgi:uncharacterized protein (DUF885 family)